MVELFKLINITLVGASLINFHPTFKKCNTMVNLTPHNFSGDKLGYKGRYELAFYATWQILT